MLMALVVLFASAQKTPGQLYSGGMLFWQPGISLTSNPQQKINALSNSVGGILRFYLTDYITAGIYGGSMKTAYDTEGSENSYLSLGYGGLFAGLSKKVGKFRYSISAFGGMGSLRNLHIRSENDQVLTDANLYQSPVFLTSPILSVDYAFTQKLSLTVQTICLMGKTNTNHRLYNPTIQLGILFSR